MLSHFSDEFDYFDGNFLTDYFTRRTHRAVPAANYHRL